MKKLLTLLMLVGAMCVCEAKPRRRAHYPKHSHYGHRSHHSMRYYHSHHRKYRTHTLFVGQEARGCSICGRYIYPMHRVSIFGDRALTRWVCPICESRSYYEHIYKLEQEYKREERANRYLKKSYLTINKY